MFLDTRVALDADDEAYGIHPLAQTKLQFTGEIVRIIVGAEYPIPNRQLRPQVFHLMRRVAAMVNVVIAGRHEDPFQPG